MMKKMIKFTLILICIIFYLCGCNNDEKLAKETYELISNASDNIIMYLMDQYNLSCSIYTDEKITTDDLYIDNNEIANAFVIFVDKNLEQDTINIVHNTIEESLDDTYILFINTITNIRDINIDYAAIGCEHIIQIAYTNNESIDKITKELDAIKTNLKLISEKHKSYTYLKDYYLDINNLFELANSLNGGLYYSSDEIETYFDNISKYQSELDYLLKE